MIIVANRELIIPHKEQYIGTTYDKQSEYRQFLLDRVTVGGVDLANLHFVLDMEYMSGDFNAVQLSKEILEDKVILTWPLLESELQVTGTTFINIRAIDNTDGKVKWASFRAPVYIEDTIYTPGHYTGDLTELEQMEAAFQLDMERNADLYDMIKAAYDNHEFDGNGIADITMNSDYTLTITMDDGTTYTTTSIRGPQGVSGVFVGPAPLPAGFNVWVDTEGETPVPEDGGYYIPSVDEHGIISWTASEDNMPVIQPRNIKGLRGDSFLWRGDYDAAKIYLPMDVAKYNGASWLCLKECHEVTPADGEYWAMIAAKGDSGPPTAFSVGTVETLDPDDDAYVTMTGTDSKVLNFGIPKGADGTVPLDVLYRILPADTASGASASFPDGADNIPIASLITEINPSQDGSGTASPTNPRAIGARTSVTITVTDGTNTKSETIALDPAVYGGELNVTTGELTSNGKYVVMDGTEDWAAETLGGRTVFKLELDDAAGPDPLSVVGTAIVGTAIVGSTRMQAWASMGTYDPTSFADGTIWIENGYLYYCPDSSITTLAAFETWLGSNNMEVVYTCDTDTTVNIDPVEITTYRGSNTITSNSGDVDVEYHCDIQAYIDKKVN